MADDETLYEALETSLNGCMPIAPRVERRRSWHPQQKMAIVQESCLPGAVPTQVARRYGISTGLLYTWRRNLLTAATDGFVRCEVVGEHGVVALPAPEARSPLPALSVPDRPAAGTIEVEWTCPDKVGSFLPMKGKLDEQAEGFYAGI